MHTELSILALSFGDVIGHIKNVFVTISEAVSSFGLLGRLVLALLVFFILKKVSKGLQICIEKALNKTTLDNKISAKINQNVNVEKGLSATVYAIALLFSAIFALDIAKLDVASQPLMGLFNQIIDFIPKLAVAGVLVYLLVIILNIVKGLLTNVLATAKIDERLGNVTGQNPVAKSIVTAVHCFLFLFFIPIVLDILQIDAISKPIKGIVDMVLGSVQPILIAGLTIAIGFLVGGIAKRLVENLLNATNVNSFPAKLGFNTPTEGKGSVSAIIGSLVMVTIAIITLTAGIDALGINILSDLSQGFVEVYLNILIAVIVLGAGFIGAKFAYNALVGQNACLAKMVRIAIIVVSTVIALERTGLSDLTSLPYEIALYAVGVAFAIGGGIALGTGGKEFVQRYLSKKG